MSTNDYNRYQCSRFEALAWLNRTLKAQYSSIDELGTGIPFCLLTDMLFPGSIPIDKLKFNSSLEYDYMVHFKYVQNVLQNQQITANVPILKLVKKTFAENYMLLKWFKALFEDHHDSGDPFRYDPVAARGGVFLGKSVRQSGKRCARTVLPRQLAGGCTYVPAKTRKTGCNCSHGKFKNSLSDLTLETSETLLGIAKEFPKASFLVVGTKYDINTEQNSDKAKENMIEKETRIDPAFERDLSLFSESIKNLLYKKLLAKKVEKNIIEFVRNLKKAFKAPDVDQSHPFVKEVLLVLKDVNENRKKR